MVRSYGRRMSYKSSGGNEYVSLQGGRKDGEVSSELLGGMSDVMKNLNRGSFDSSNPPFDNFEEFVRRLEGIESMGYVETNRSGNTGVGKTLEDLLYIDENNEQAPDFDDIELKSSRKGSSNMLTLFCKEPSEKFLWGTDLIERFGYVDDKGRDALKVTLNVGDVNNRGFYLNYDSSSVEIKHEDYGVCSKYTLDLLEETFKKKHPEFVIVKADVKKKGGSEYFHYNEAYHLRGFNPDKFVELMRDSVISLDLRMHIKDSGGLRNRGTAWRIKDKSMLEKAYDERTEILKSNSEGEIRVSL
jgi:hypothetical protein